MKFDSPAAWAVSFLGTSQHRVMSIVTLAPCFTQLFPLDLLEATRMEELIAECETLSFVFVNLIQTVKPCF